MRQLLIEVQREEATEVLGIARRHNGTNLAWVEAFGGDQPLALVIVHVSNGKVEELLEELQLRSDLHITLIPHEVMPLRPPADKASEQVTDVELRSPIEVFLTGLQSVGSWKGFLGYAAVAGVVVWIGLFTNTSYLLVAAMLIAPFAGPAMNTALATARGDSRLLGRSVLRYFTALAVTIAVGAVLSLVWGQDIATSAMVSTAEVSAVAVLLPLTAGLAGALNLVQSERSSLVSGAATGMLVAASLAPPAGLIGMASAMGQWEMARDGLFQLLLQLAGITWAGAMIFRLCGITSHGARYRHGKRWLFPAALAVTTAALTGLLAWQFSHAPQLQRSSTARRAAAEVQKVVESSGLAQLVEADIRFTRPSIPGQNTLLIVLYVQPRTGVQVPPEALQRRLTRDVQRRLREQGFNITPLVQVNVLKPPDQTS